MILDARRAGRPGLTPGSTDPLTTRADAAPDDGSKIRESSQQVKNDLAGTFCSPFDEEPPNPRRAAVQNKMVIPEGTRTSLSASRRRDQPREFTRRLGVGDGWENERVAFEEDGKQNRAGGARVGPIHSRAYLKTRCRNKRRRRLRPRRTSGARGLRVLSKNRRAAGGCLARHLPEADLDGAVCLPVSDSQSIQATPRSSLPAVSVESSDDFGEFGCGGRHCSLVTPLPSCSLLLHPLLPTERWRFSSLSVFKNDEINLPRAFEEGSSHFPSPRKSLIGGSFRLRT